MPPGLPESTAAPATFYARVARGSIYLDRELCDLYLPGVSAVAILRREGRMFLVPLTGTAAGGLLLKVRNARGDRVVHAPETLTSPDMAETGPERIVPVRWNQYLHGLLLEGFEPAAEPPATT
ncbi:MAG: hypothetical protein ACOZDY_20270 [Pseudomonadota bacterium]